MIRICALALNKKQMTVGLIVSVKCSYDGTSPEHLAPRA